jgi:hypothetical protein
MVAPNRKLVTLIFSTEGLRCVYWDIRTRSDSRRFTEIEISSANNARRPFEAALRCRKLPNYPVVPWRITERAGQNRIDRPGLPQIVGTKMNVSTFAIKAALAAAIAIAASTGVAEARGGGGGGGGGGHGGGGFGGGHAGGGFGSGGSFGGHGMGGGFAGQSFRGGLMTGRSVGFAHQGVGGGLHNGYTHRGARYGGYGLGYGYGYPCTYDYDYSSCDYGNCCY